VFAGRSKDDGKGVFSRERKLTLKNLILLIVTFKSSIQRELDMFFKEVSHSDFNIREVTKGAFTQARYRKGFWSIYPECHIGRVYGETTPFPSNAFFMRKYGDIPSDEWRFDANSLGTNDFRSSKDNIYWASLTNIKGNGILVSSDGNHSFSSFVNDGKISFLVADYFNGGAEIFFRSHLANERNPLKRGDHFRESITLNLINGEKK